MTLCCMLSLHQFVENQNDILENLRLTFHPCLSMLQEIIFVMRFEYNTVACWY